MRQKEEIYLGITIFFADSFFLELSKELLINVIVAVAVHKFLSHSDKSAH